MSEQPCGLAAHKDAHEIERLKVKVNRARLQRDYEAHLVAEREATIERVKAAVDQIYKLSLAARADETRGRPFSGCYADAYENAERHIREALGKSWDATRARLTAERNEARDNHARSLDRELVLVADLRARDAKIMRQKDLLGVALATIERMAADLLAKDAAIERIRAALDECRGQSSQVDNLIDDIDDAIAGKS